MADLNALIAQGVQFKAPPDPFAQYAQMQQMQQGQTANELARYQLSSAQRADTLNEGILNYMRSPGYKPEGLPQFGAPGIAALKTITEAQNAGLTGKKLQGEVNTGDFDLRVKKANKAITDIAALSSPEEAITSINDHLAKGDIDVAKADALKAQLTQAPSFQKWRTDMVMGILGAKDKLEMTRAKPTQINVGNAIKTIDMNPDSPTFKQEVAPAQTLSVTPGEASTAATALAGQRITARGQDIVAGTAAKALAQAGNLPLQESLAAARERGTLTTKNQVTAQAILPKVIADAETALQGITGMIGSAQVDKTGKVSYPQGGTQAHPGFESAVGAGFPGLKYVPGSSAADFNKRFDQVMGGAFLDAYESLRGANAITDIEGAKGTAAKTRMSTAQSEVEFVRAARELESIVRKGIERAKAKAKAGAAPAAVPAAGEWGKAVAE